MQSVFKFSESLRLEAIAYFEKRSKQPVSHEQADLYLAQLAELLIAFEGIEAEHFPLTGTAEEPSPLGDAPRLPVPSSYT